MVFKKVESLQEYKSNKLDILKKSINNSPNSKFILDNYTLLDTKFLDMKLAESSNKNIQLIIGRNSPQFQYLYYIVLSRSDNFNLLKDSGIIYDNEYYSDIEKNLIVFANEIIFRFRNLLELNYKIYIDTDSSNWLKRLIFKL